MARGSLLEGWTHPGERISVLMGWDRVRPGGMFLNPSRGTRRRKRAVWSRWHTPTALLGERGHVAFAGLSLASSLSLNAGWSPRVDQNRDKGVHGRTGNLSKVHMRVNTQMLRLNSLY